jgi:hypothetical protein
MRPREKKLGQAQTAIRPEKEEEREFAKLFRRFRTAADPKESKRLGDKLGQMVFGG